MSDDRVRTFVKLQGTRGAPVPGIFRARPRARHGRANRTARCRAGASAARRDRSDSRLRAVILAPSNPFVSLGPILALRGMREALRSARSRVAAISPIVGGKTIKGPADKMMRGLGHEVSPLGVARLYRDFVGVFVLDEVDRRYLEPIREAWHARRRDRYYHEHPGPGRPARRRGSAARLRCRLSPPMASLTLTAIEGIPLVKPGDNLAELIVARARKRQA